MTEAIQREMWKQFKQALAKIKEYDKIVVYRHTSPDYDAFGSQLGLAYWLKLNFPNKEIFYVGESHHTFVPTLFPQPMELPDSWYEENNKQFLAIVTDTGNTKRISESRIDKAAYVIKFDHHPNVEPYADLNIVYTNFSSCAELIALFEYSQPRKYKIDQKIATFLFTGIVGDSGRFMFNTTSSTTFKLAAELLNAGVDMQDVYHKMYKTSWKMINFKKFVLNNYKLTEKGTFYYVITNEDLKELGIERDEGKIGLNEFTNVDGVMACLSITESDNPEQRYRVSARSSKKVVGPTMAKFGGGGHDYAAGGYLKDLSELDSLIKAIDEA